MAKIDFHPTEVPKGYRKNMIFQNRNKHDIHIEHLRFQSNIHPREWDTPVEKQLCLGCLEGGSNPYPQFSVPIVGTGTIFMRWYGISRHEEQADTFEVLFDDRGEPWPYIFGGDRWTMALRHAALRAGPENGD